MVMARLNTVASLRNTPMPIIASIMISSQFPLVFGEPSRISGRYTSRSMVANRVTRSAGQPV